MSFLSLVLVTQIFPASDLPPLYTSLLLPPHCYSLPLIFRGSRSHSPDPPYGWGRNDSSLSVYILESPPSICGVLCWPRLLTHWAGEPLLIDPVIASKGNPNASNYRAVSVCQVLFTVISNSHINLWDRHYPHFTHEEDGGSGRPQRPSNPCLHLYTWWWVSHQIWLLTLSSSF